MYNRLMTETALRYEKVTIKNINLAIKIQKTIFPNEDGSLNLIAAADKSLIEKIYGEGEQEVVDFWLCKNQDNEFVGMTGIYSNPKYSQTQDAWCGWFGVLPKFRDKGYGKKIFLWTMNKAKTLGYRNFRLYTDLEDNKVATELYRKVGMIEEPYIGEDMSPYKFVIFSKNLYSNKTEKIGNRNLFLKHQEEIQNRAAKDLKKLINLKHS